MTGFLSVSVIIPTKGRPAILESLVRILLKQTFPAAQLVIVDQTPSEEGRQRVEAIFRASADQSEVRLSYIHDPSILGAASARNRGMSVADGQIWLFLDDDMEPEPDFLEQLQAVYSAQPAVSGVSGIVTNYKLPSLAFRLWARLFLRGPFYDERQPIYWDAERLREGGPIPVSQFGSGLMSFRASAVQDVRFDGALRGLPPGEDLDFCARLGPSVTLVIAPRARIAHRASEIGRAQDYWVREYAQGKLYTYHRNWRHGLADRVWCIWFEMGCALVATVASVRRGSLRPWRAFLTGVREATRLGTPPQPSGGER